jgi:ribosome maturation factor RimP
VSRIADTVKELCTPITAQLDLELVEVEYVREGNRWILRVTIDSDAGISHADCEAVSRQLDEALEKADPIAGTYDLEVTSPGAERPLRTDRDFIRFQGRLVLVKTFAPIKGKKEWTGNLIDRAEGVVRIRVGDQELAFTQEQVSLVRLTVDFRRHGLDDQREQQQDED